MPNYEKRGSSWRVRFNTYEGGKEIRKSLTAPTKKEAREAYEKYIREYEARKVVAEEETVRTIRQLAEKYLEHQKDRIKESTFEIAQSHIRVRILPMLGDAEISSLKPSKIDEWYSSMNGLEYGYKRAIYTRLKCMFRYGTKYFGLPNPMDGLDTPRNPGKRKNEMSIWTTEEFGKFLSVVEDDVDKLYFKFLFFSGCRKGEAEALRHEDFLPDGRVNINKTLFYAKGGFKITTPKNDSSERIISIPRQLYEEIVATFKPGEVWVFSHDGFYPFSRGYSLYALNRFAKKAGIKKIRVHDLRHSCASMLISSGVPITAVSKQLGHANVTMTLNVYAHLLPSDEEKVSNALNVYYNSTQNGANLGQK